MRRRRSRGWMALLVLLVVAVAVGVGAYNLGVSHGVAVGSAMASGGTAARPPWAYAYGWHRGWGGGLFVPFFFLAFWLLAARFLFFRRWRRAHWYGRYGYDIPPAFEHWHRRAHERMPDNDREGAPTHLL